MKKSADILVILFISTYPFFGYAQNHIKLGAYYFDGWSNNYPTMLTSSLKDSFNEREPKWGWLTSTQQIVDQQINEAANGGLSFFSFCWYFSSKEKYKQDPLNRALQFYLNSSENHKLKYCLMIANHQGFVIRPDDWHIVVEDWVQQFKSTNYLNVDGRPLLIFFSVPSLIKQFGSARAVHAALDSLREASIKVGLSGVNIAAAVWPNKKEIGAADSCGFDLLTGYNYHSNGFTVKNTLAIPIDSMQNAEKKMWDAFKSVSKLKYVPVSTLGWDPRPWANNSNGYDKAPYFKGFSQESVYKSVRSCIDWLEKNGNSTTKDKIGLLYAWNEYGEGSYLTPSKNGNRLLKGVARAIKKQ